MCLNNMFQYVSTGSIFGNKKKTYRKNSIAPVLLTLMAGTIPGIILKKYWIYMTFALWIISITCILTVFLISSKEITLKRCLCMDICIFGTWVLDLSVLELMYLTMWKGFNPWFCLLFLPVILAPTFSGIKIHKLLKKSDYTSKKIVQSNVRTIGFLSGILGMNFAAIFRNVDQGVAFIVVLLCLSILNTFMSLGLLSLQKLYYIKKLNISL